MFGLCWGYIWVMLGLFLGYGYIGVIFGLCWGYMGIMEKKMETTIIGYTGFRVCGLGPSAGVLLTSFM